MRAPIAVPTPLALAVASLAMLAGSCAGSAASPPGTAPPPPVPATGQCTAVGDGRPASPDRAPAMVPCEGPHAGEVWRAVALSAPWSDPATPRPDPGSAGERELGAIAAARCAERDWRSYANLRSARETVNGTRSLPTALRNRWYYPAPEAWAQGERWLRCELAVAWGDPAHVTARWTGPLATMLAERANLRVVNSDCRAGGTVEGTEPVPAPCDEAHDVEVVSTYRVTRSVAPTADPPTDAVCAQDARDHLGAAELDAGTSRFARTSKARTEPAMPGVPEDEVTVACVLSFTDRVTGQPVRTLDTARGLAAADPRPA